MNRRIVFLAVFFCCLSIRLFAFSDPFSVTAALEADGKDVWLLKVSLGVPPQHYLYANEVYVDVPAGVVLTPRSIPAPKTEFDSFSKANRRKYTHDVQFTYLVSNPGRLLPLTVRYQGCSQSLCFLPGAKHFDLKADISESPNPQSAIGNPNSQSAFSVAGRAVGYMPPKDFLRFLEQSKEGKPALNDRLAETLSTGSFTLALLLILIGGLALNLTPCVLPLIPINLAIIGAGARSGSRLRGFLLGGSYGAGMALAYGSLGLIAALGGVTFGALNSSPWFNYGIAVLFLILGLAMFDLISIDLSRLREGSSKGLMARPAGYVAAFAMGAIAALLAGACVAPVIISVLLLSGQFYASGRASGLLLPFVLGIGMALPWPFVGAGLSLLPKPGRWMVAVKYLFGFFILSFALYYGYEGYSLHRGRLGESGAKDLVASQEKRIATEAWLTSLPNALRVAREQGKPVLIDFWASWCKACLTMDRTTLQNAEVKKELEGFVKVKVRAENPNEPPARDMLARFQVIGLPTYIVIKP